MDDFKKKVDEYYELRKENDDRYESIQRQCEIFSKLKGLNHVALIDILNKDIESVISEYNEAPTQSKRRNLIRAIFSFIEGSLYTIKEELFIRESHKRSPILSTEELTLLSEKFPHVADNGKVKTSQKFIPLYPNLVFTFKTYIKSFNLNHEFKTEGPEKKIVKESIEIRNRITHPKKFSDLEITENDLVKAYITFLWFKNEMFILFDESKKELKIQLDNKCITY